MQRKYVAGRLSGRSKKKAALAAGYSEKSARHAKHKIEGSPAVKDLFQRGLTLAGVTDKLIAQRVYQGLHATETKFATYDGEITDFKTLINFSERREMVELVCKLKGLLIEKHDVTGRLTLEQLLDGTHE